MKKIFLIIMFFFCLGIVNAETILLDSVEPGSISTWTQYNSGYNPYPTFSEVLSPYDLTTALKIEVNGYTYSYCDQPNIYKIYDLGGIHNTDKTELKAYIEFEYSGTYYNFPYVYVFILDNNDEVLGQHIWYGKDIVGGLYQSYIASDPESYTELPSDKGYFTLDLSEIGKDIDYRKIKVALTGYTCVGTNSVVIDEISLKKSYSSNDEPVDEIPEFGVIAGGIALIGALGIFAFSRRK